MWQRIARDDACKWCQTQQGQGKYYYEINFARHSHCRCIIINTNAANVLQGSKLPGIWKAQTFEEMTEESLDQLVKNYKARNITKAVKLIDVKDEMLVLAKPGQGKIIGKFNDPNPAVSKVDTDQANWIIKTFGGDVKPLSTSLVDGIKKADSLWTSNLYRSSKLLEFKASNGSKSSINFQIRKASKQINNDDVLLIDLNDKTVRDIDIILEQIKKEANNYRVNNVIVKQQNKLIAFFIRK